MEQTGLSTSVYEMDTFEADTIYFGQMEILPSSILATLEWQRSVSEPKPLVLYVPIYNKF